MDEPERAGGELCERRLRRAPAHEHERTGLPAAAGRRDDERHARAPGWGNALWTVDRGTHRVQVGGFDTGGDDAQRDALKAPERRCRDRDRIRRRARRADDARLEVVAVVAGRHDGRNAGLGRTRDRPHRQVVGRIDLGLADRQVEHVHAVRDRLVDRLGDRHAVAVEPESGRRHGEHAVVAEERARSHA